jgi:hypothetical protein
MGRPKCSAHRMIDKHRPRRGNFAHNIVRRAGNQRRNALTFDDVGNETDGLMAKRSIRNEQGKIDLSIR